MKSYKILIIEDELIVAQDLANRLTASGYTIIGIENTGAAALALAERHHPDLVLTDIHLSNDKSQMDGISIAAELQRKYLVAVVFLTAYSEQSTVEKAKEVQPFGYVLKPVDDRELIIVLEMALIRFEVEKKVRESEHRLRILTSTTPTVFIEIDRQWTIRYTTHSEDNPNPALKLGASIPDCFPARQQPAIKALLQEVFSFAKPKTMEISIPDALGCQRILLSHFTPVIQDGNVSSVILTTTDITERKSREQWAEARSRLLEYSSTLSIQEICEKGLEMVRNATSSELACVCVMDYSKDCRPPGEQQTACVKWSCFLQPESLAGEIKSQMHWSECYDQRKPVVRNSDTEVFRSISEGSSVLIHREYIMPVVQNNNVTLVMGVANKPSDYTPWDGRLLADYANLLWDIISRKQASDALHESESMLQHAQRVARLGHYSFDVSSGAWTGSDMLDQIFGITRDTYHTLEGWLSLVHPDDRNSMQELMMEQVIKNGKPFDKEYRILRKTDGVLRWVHGLGTLEFDTNGKLVKMFGTIQDITERKHLESQLFEATKMQTVGQLAGGMAHEFNNILGAMTMNVDMLRTTVQGTDNQESLSELNSLIKRSANLVANLLAFSQKSLLKPASLDLGGIVSLFYRTQRKILGDKIQVHCVIPPSLPAIDGDQSLIERALLNLSLNAIDAMPNGGKLQIELKSITLDENQTNRHPDARKGQFVCLTMTDTGCGMSKQTQARLFEPFFSTKDVGKGSGLGLSMVHGIVHQHNGWIEVHSEPGKGTTFHLFFPIQSATLPAAKPSSDVIPGGHETILLVEEETSLLKALSRFLRHYGYKVIEAGTAAEALSQWENNHGQISLLFTDLDMSTGIEGVELAGRLRQVTPSLQVIISSGYSTEAASAERGSAGRVICIPKPYAPAELAGIIRCCLDGTPFPWEN